MKGFIFFLIACAAIFSACSSPSSNEIIIEGNIEGLKSGDKIIVDFVSFQAYSTFEMDTIVVNGSKFSYRKTLSQQPYVVCLTYTPADTAKLKVEMRSIDRRSIAIYAALGDKIRIKGTAANVNFANVSGGYYNNFAVKQYEAKRDSVFLLLANYEDSVSMARKEGNKEAGRKFEAISDSFYIIGGALKEEFISMNPDQIYSALLFLPSSGYQPLDMVKKQYESFTPEVQNSPCGLVIKAKIEKREATAVGAKLPPFSVVDINGNTINSASFAGKYVLLDFWGSWCIWCRKANPKLVEAYKKYKHKKFTIIGLAMDDRDRLLHAVEKDGITWAQALISQPENAQVQELFSISVWPTYMLISPQGIILTNTSNFSEGVLPILNKELK